MVAQSLEEFDFYGTRPFIALFTTTHRSILFEISLIHFTPHIRCTENLHFNLILLPQMVSLTKFSSYNFIFLCLLYHSGYVPRPSYFG